MGSIRPFVTILAVCCLLALYAGGGCSEEQLSKADKIAADANSFSTGLWDFAEGPAGQALPPTVRLVLELLGYTGAAAVLLWQRIRGKLVKVTLASVVQAVESLDDKTQAVVKEVVEQRMLKTGTYDGCNAVVDKLKGA